MRYCSDRLRKELGNLDQKFQFYKVFMKVYTHFSHRWIRFCWHYQDVQELECDYVQLNKIHKKSYRICSI